MLKSERQKRDEDRALRAKWMSTAEACIVGFCTDLVLRVTCLNARNRHYRISGVRDVELYATTGTVNAAPSNGKGAINVRAWSLREH